MFECCENTAKGSTELSSKTNLTMYECCLTECAYYKI